MRHCLFDTIQCSAISCDTIWCSVNKCSIFKRGIFKYCIVTGAYLNAAFCDAEFCTVRSFHAAFVMRTCQKSRLQTNWRYYNTSPLKIQYNPINSQIIQHLYVSENRFQDAFSHISLFRLFPVHSRWNRSHFSTILRSKHAALLIVQNPNAIIVTQFSSHIFRHVFLSHIFRYTF